MDLTALAKQIAAARGISLDEATQQLESWLADPANVWTTEADILAAFGMSTQGGTDMATPSEQQAQRDQEEAQFSHLAEAVYALIKGDTQTAKTELNALNPEHFTFD